MKRLSGLMLLLGVAALVTAPAMAQDNPEGPWPMINGDQYGRARTTAPLLDWSQGMEIAWTIDVNTNPANIDITQTRVAPVFDAAGNIYWLSSSGGLAGNSQWVVSADVNGNVRWRSQDPLCIGGNGFGSVVVGANAVYGFAGGLPSDYDGDMWPGYAVAAFNKATGARIWLTDIDGAWTNDPNDPAPVFVDSQSETAPLLYNGVLYFAWTGSQGLVLTQVNAATGAVLHHDVIDAGLTTSRLTGTLTLVPDVFGGDDGIFMNTANWGPGYLYGIKLSSTSTPPGQASDGWGGFQMLGQSEGRSHVIYSPTNQKLYVHHWNDNGSGFETYDPVTGNVIDFSARAEGNFGYVDVAALTWDDKTVALGSFNGQVALFEVDSAGMIVRPASPLFFGGLRPWGEPHYFGQLLREDPTNPNDHGVLITTGSLNAPTGCPATYPSVVLLDLNRAQLPPADVNYFAPAYIDNVEIIGVDPNGVETTVLASDFDAASGWILGALAGQKAEWVDGGSAGSTIAQIVTDPNNPSNQVMMLDAAAPGEYPAAKANFPEIGPTNGYAKGIIRWQQFRADLNDDLYLNPSGLRWGIESSFLGLVSAIDAWWETPNSFAKPTAGVWQTVEYVIDQTDPANTLVSIYVNGVNEPCRTGYLAANPVVTSMYWDVTGTNWPAPFDPPALASYDVGTPDDLRSAVAGPDGKVYFQKSGNPRALIALRPAGTAVMKGDMNCDGVVDFKDINPFVAILSGGTPCNAANADTNCDNVIDFKDINPFVALLSGGTPCQ